MPLLPALSSTSSLDILIFGVSVAICCLSKSTCAMVAVGIVALVSGKI